MLVLESVQAGAENLLTDHLGVLDDLLFFHRFDGGHDAGTCQRVTRVGKTSGEDALIEGVSELVVDNHTTNGDVTRVHALGEGDEVRNHIERVEGKPFTCATEPSHDLIQDENNAVLICQGTNTLEVSRWGSEDACSAGNGFNQEGRNTCRAFCLNGALEEVEGTFGFLLRGGCPVLSAVKVGAKNVLVTT